MKISDFLWFIYLFTKKACSSFFHIHGLPSFQGPVGYVGAMYQSVGKCSRMHLRAASIHKISAGLGGPLTLRRFLGARLAPRTDTLPFQAG